MRKVLLLGMTLLMLSIVSSELLGQVSLVKDINPGVGWANLEFKYRIGNHFYFVANSDFGKELWISDGTPNGTIVLKDINANPATGSDPDHFVEWNGVWYFSADDGMNGRELWQTDGTTAGTVLLKDIYPGSQSSNPSGLVVLNGVLYFNATDGSTGYELWKSDGTEMGTVQVADINTGTSSADPEHMIALGSSIIFTANNGTNGNELWKSDGTSGGTELLKDIQVGMSSSFATDLTLVGDKVYFIADDGTTGKEIWRTDGTTGGTEFTTDIVAGAGHPQTNELNAAGDFLFFVGDNGTNGLELFRSDSNAPAAVELVELFPDTFGSAPTNFIHLNGDLLFNAASSGFGYELWKANATDGSVELVKDIYPGFSSGFPIMLAVVNGELIFKANGENIGLELYKTDGTESGTVLIGDLNTDPNSNLGNSDPQRPMLKDNILYFTAWDANSEYQIWQTDGTSTSTQKLTNIPHDTIFNNTYKPYFINNIGNTVINFVALGDPVGEELWQEDIDPITISNVQTNSPLDCNGDTDGTIDVFVTGGVGDPSCFTYQWSSPGLEGLNLTDLAAGNYTLTVTDCVGFTSIITIDIEQPEAVGGTTQQVAMVSCFGGADGIALVNGTGGIGVYTYQWSNGQSGATATNLPSGTHSVTITDENGCIGEASVLITEPNSLQLDTDIGAVICFDGGNGEASVNPAGGTPNYTYLWDNGATTALVSNLTGGNHSVTVTDANGCTAVATVGIEFFPELEIEFINENVSCINGNNGSTTAVPFGGTGTGYTFLWNTGATMNSLNDIGSGSYSVIVTDDNGCTGTASTTILTPEVSINLVNNVSCFNGANGGAAISIENPNSTYTYAWDNGETTATASMLGVGTHMVTVTDALACSSIQSITISEPAAFVFADSIVVGPSCFGTADGFISYNFSGGSMPYSYQWSTGATTTGTLTGLTGNASYCVTVTDAFECDVFEFCTTLEEPAELSADLVSSISTSCSDSCDGSLGISSGGGVYTFNWSNGDSNTGTTSSVNGLCADNYIVTISDGMCLAIEVFSVGGPEPVESEFTVTNTSCFGGSDGTVSADVTGGTAPYSFNYSNGTSNLSAGEYTVTITDDNGCTVIETFAVNEPSQITVAYDVQNPSCNGDEDGSVEASANGGTEPYTFEFPDGQDGLSAGTYSVVVTDANGCVSVDSFMVIEPDSLSASVEVQNVSCFGGADGNVNVTPNGGTEPYEIIYNSGGPDDLEAGTYIATIIDSNNCVNQIEFDIEEPEEITVGISGFNTISCFGGNDGSVSLNIMGGVLPYQIEGDLDNLPAGPHTITIMDANGCETELTFVMDQPEELILNTSSTDATGTEADGTATVSVSGGVSPYTFEWNTDPVQNTETATGLTAGEYQVTVTDANGCSSVTTVTVGMTNGIEELNENLRFILYPNPAETIVALEFGFSFSELVEVNIYDALGRKVFYRAPEFILYDRMELNLSHLNQGTYLVQLRNENGQFVKRLSIIKD